MASSAMSIVPIADDPVGSYPIDSVQADEHERLRLQDDAWASDAHALLDQIGVGAGWHCLDLGCGPKGLTDILSQRVGPTGKVVGLELNPAFTETARKSAPANVEIVTGNAYATGLPGGSFDLVHMRFLASTAGEPERLVSEAKRLLKPGGILATQEADGATLRCFPPHSAWIRLLDALVTCFPTGFGEDPVAHRLYRLMQQTGFENCHYRPSLVGVRSGDPWHDYLPSTTASLRNVFEARGLFTPHELDDTLAACRAHLADPDTVFVSPMLVQVWGRMPSTAQD
jgi:SAM-dependent methyltransferase